jgi:uncharacterized protein YprB with RNaseH-like and TPR domain
MTRKQIETFLLEKQGYLKKSPLVTAKALWKQASKTLPKTRVELNKELAIIKDVQSNLRLAQTITHTKQEQKLIDSYNEIVEFNNKPKRKLFFDIETSPNIVLSWRIGRDVSLSHDDILQERAIICICYKWSDEDVVHSLEWNKGNDKELMKKFSKIIDSADEVIGQNSDAYDIKWIRTRAIFHNIPISPKFNSIDTLKMARQGFKFNSNKLDYMGKFLGVGGKIETTYSLWKDILLSNCPKAMKQMVDYCKIDVVRLEEVYNKLKPYCPEKKFRYKV